MHLMYFTEQPMSAYPAEEGARWTKGGSHKKRDQSRNRA